MPSTPNKLNLSFARSAYSVFGNRNANTTAENQHEQKTELLEDTSCLLARVKNISGSSCLCNCTNATPNSMLGVESSICFGLINNKKKNLYSVCQGTRGNGLLHLKNGVDYINAGEEDQMEIYGYKRNPLRTTVTWILITCTAGLLRLIFHWIPHLMLLATHSKCSFEEAETVLLVERFQGKHTSYWVKKLKTVSAEEVSRMSNDGDSLLDKDAFSDDDVLTDFEEDKVPLTLSVHLSGGQFKNVKSMVTFSCKKLTYVWDTDRSEFLKLKGLDEGVLTTTLHQMRGLNAEDQFMRRYVYGNNEIIIPVKSILTLFCLEVLNPFYVFQLFSFCLWIADDYFYYAMAILTMSGCGIATAVYQTRKNQQNLRSTVHSSDVATVIRDPGGGKTATIPTKQLVPGDVLVIPSHGCIMPCDAVLLTGNCILNESMLTGESVPVTKTPIPAANEILYDTKEHARHTLYCGTQVIQTRYFGNEKVVAVVIRTGFSTSKGGLVRSIMYPPPVDFKFEQDSYKFVAILASIASVGFFYTVITKALRGIAADEIALEALDLITIVVPPALPAAMTVGRLMAQNRLKKRRIYCTSPRAINVSGSIDCVCFDKTGTLTEDGLDMWGVVPVSNKSFQSPVKDIITLPLDEILIGMVTCHSITIINAQLAGDPLDLKVFESTGWQLEEPDVSDTSKFSMLFPTIVKPPKNSKIANDYHSDLTLSPGRQNSTNSAMTDNMGETISNLEETISESTMQLNQQSLEIGIVRQFPFTSSLQRMSVITRTLGANHFDLYCKGSPEMILSLSKPESIPSDFASVLQEYTSEGYRVIALAHKSLNRLSYAKAQRIAREAAETDLKFLAFVILENRLKPGTSRVIKTLNEACIKTVMVTGDNMLTALSVARECEIIKHNVSVIAVAAITQQNLLKPQIYFTQSNSQHSPTSPMGNDISEMTDLNSVASLETIENGSSQNNHPQNQISYLSDDLHISSNKYVFSLTGKTWAMIKQHYPELIPKLATRGAIFARMSPDQKQQLVQELQALGYYVAMVGDGANDCGALKAAHTGISLSDTESSVASPFTSRDTDISCLLSVIREGRAALVTSFGNFKYMAAYSLTQFVSVMLLYHINANLTDFEFLYIDLFIISIFAFFFSKTEAYDGPLVKTAPLTSLMSTSPILSIAMQILIVFIFQYTSLWHLRQQDWFKLYSDQSDSKHSESDASPENYTIFSISSMQYIILAVVFSKGKPYRKPLWTNWGLLTSFILMSLFSVYMTLCPFEWLADQFELALPTDVSFRYVLVIYGLANLVISIIVEYFFIEYIVFGKLRYRWHDIDKSKKRYLAIERDMASDHKWPPVSQEPLPEAAPDLLIRQNNLTEIKIENITETHPIDDFINSNASAQANPSFKRFGSAREVPLNPRSLFNDQRTAVSMQTVPNFEDGKDVYYRPSPRSESMPKRRHNSESENGIYPYEKSYRNYNTNPIATLPRNPPPSSQQVAPSDEFKSVMVHKSEESNFRSATQSVLELDILPS